VFNDPTNSPMFTFTGEKSRFHSLASCLRSFEGDGRGGGPPCLELGISDITSVISALRGGGVPLEGKSRALRLGGM
jgi:hypothetical protein